MTGIGGDRTAARDAVAAEAREQRVAVGRRRFLGLGAGALAAALLGPSDALAAIRAPARELSLLNTHTGERLRAEYWVRGRYVTDALVEINGILRDHRTNERHPIDRELLDLVHLLHARVGRTEPFHVISGYRSPVTNAMLAGKSSGVAINSYHMRGMAMDLRMPGLGTRDLYRTALRLRGGGVGYYPDSRFVHVDVGPVRTW